MLCCAGQCGLRVPNLEWNPHFSEPVSGVLLLNKMPVTLGCEVTRPSVAVTGARAKSLRWSRR
jgi:hypothetical protein